MSETPPLWLAIVATFAAGASFGLALPMLRYRFASKRRRARFGAAAVDAILLIAWHMSAGTWAEASTSFKIVRRIARVAGPASSIEGLVMLGRLTAELVDSDDPVFWASLRERLEAALAEHGAAS